MKREQVGPVTLLTPESDADRAEINRLSLRGEADSGVRLKEHGDKQAMSPDEYAAYYHPGKYASMGQGPQPTVPKVHVDPRTGIEVPTNLPAEFVPPRDLSTKSYKEETDERLRQTHLFREQKPFEGMPREERTSVLASAEDLAQQGFGLRIDQTGLTPPEFTDNGEYFPKVNLLRLNAIPSLAGGYSASRSAGDIFRHEYGHAVYFAMPEKYRFNLKAILEQTRTKSVRSEGLYNSILTKVSRYAIDGSPEEMWAEFFSVMTRPEYEPGTIYGDKEMWQLLVDSGNIFVKPEEPMVPIRLSSFEEHGDKARMTPAEYAQFHPGTGGATDHGRQAGIDSATAKVRDIEDHEEGIIVGWDGAHLATATGKQYSVSFANEDEKFMANNWVVHNHPTGRSFSPGDIQNAKIADMAGMTVIGTTKSGERWRYDIWRPEQGWPESDVLNRLLDRAQMAYYGHKRDYGLMAEMRGEKPDPDAEYADAMETWARIDSDGETYAAHLAMAEATSSMGARYVRVSW